MATALERREFARPGGLVSVGDHRLHIYCTGKGTPSVVLEAPAAGLSAAWADVQPALGRTRVCSLDRAGLGWSERRSAVRSGRGPGELRTLLTRANEPGPFVVVGHGLGAAFARIRGTPGCGRSGAGPDRSACRFNSHAAGLDHAGVALARAHRSASRGPLLSSRADGLAGGGRAAGVSQPARSPVARAADELLGME